MNVPPATLKNLQCGICGAQLSRGPVYLQYDGAALCGICFTPERKAFRNIHYETLALLHAFPCKYKELGCKDTVPFVQEGETIPHEDICKYRQWECPVLGSARCNWLGPRANLLQHCQDQHLDHLLQNPCTLEHDITKFSDKTYLLRALQVLFLLHVKVNVVTGKIYYSVRYLGRSGEAKDFSYTVDIKRKNAQLLRKGDVEPQGCLAIQEDTSLTLNIHSLLSVLGGFNGATFTVEVHRRVVEAKLEQQRLRVEVCEVCKKQGSVVVYRDKRGWLCESCAPARLSCNYKAEGCNYRDISNKCEKHEHYFCEQRTQCLLCAKDVDRGSLSAHLSSACKMARRIGSMWRLKPKWLPQYIVSGAADRTVCQYYLADASLDLCVFAPVPSERLWEFCCVVCVTQPSTGEVRTYTPDIQYDQAEDWRIIVEKTDFQSWDGVFNVSVDVKKH